MQRDHVKLRKNRPFAGARRVEHVPARILFGIQAARNEDRFYPRGTKNDLQIGLVGFVLLDRPRQDGLREYNNRSLVFRRLHR